MKSFRQPAFAVFALLGVSIFCPTYAEAGTEVKHVRREVRVSHECQKAVCQKRYGYSGHVFDVLGYFPGRPITKLYVVPAANYYPDSRVPSRVIWR